MDTQVLCMAVPLVMVVARTQTSHNTRDFPNKYSLHILATDAAYEIHTSSVCYENVRA